MAILCVDTPLQFINRNSAFVNQMGLWSTEVHQMSRNTISINTLKEKTDCHPSQRKTHHALTSLYPAAATGTLKCHLEPCWTISDLQRKDGEILIKWSAKILGYIRLSIFIFLDYTAIAFKCILWIWEIHFIQIISYTWPNKQVLAMPYHV